MGLWIRKWGGVGFGVMGEQGAESIHAEFNRMEARHRNQRHNSVERLRRVVVEHLTRTNPQHVAALPPAKRRKTDLEQPYIYAAIYVQDDIHVSIHGRHYFRSCARRKMRSRAASAPLTSFVVCLQV